MDNPRSSSTTFAEASTTSTASQPSRSNDGGGGRGGGYNDSSFVGNTPSTVLFFLALAVGVFIALLFIFFTIRYFIRSKYGLHVYPLSQRHALFGPNLSFSGVMGGNQSSNQELEEQIAYLRAHHMISTDILEQRATGGRRRNRRRRRRGRYSKMKKLTEQEVELLFPKKTYHDWLNGGKEDDVNLRDGVLQEEEQLRKDSKVTDDNFAMTVTKTVVTNSSDEITEATNSTDIDPKRVVTDDSTDIAEHGIELGDLSREQSSSNESTEVDKFHELHFTSGSCAICLEVLEDVDTVRGLLCGHVFHSDCLDPWLIKRRACCPMCKRDYIYNRDGTEAVSPNDNSTNNNTNDNSADNANNTTSNAASSSPNDTNTATDNNVANTATDNTVTPNNATATADATANDDDDDLDDHSFDLETFRNDPELRAMLQELIPNSERVRYILNDESLNHLDLEARAKQAATNKYGSFFKIIWWKLMGINKSDLFNWAVLTLYSKDMASARESARQNAHLRHATTGQPPTSGQTPSEPGPSSSLSSPTPSSPSPFSPTSDNAEPQSLDESITSEERQEVVDQRV